MVTRSDLRAARRLEYGETYRVEETQPVSIPPGFEESALSLPDGANSVYREDKPTDSLQIRVYSEYATIQRDKYHPKYNPVQHAVFDATGHTALALAVGGALLSGSS